MQYKPIEPGIEIYGRSAASVVAAFTYFQRVPAELFYENGIGEVIGDAIHIPPDRWYPQASWLRAFEAIALRVGAAALYKIGSRVPVTAQNDFPAWVVDLETAIKSIDFAYHSSHRKDGVVMYDPHTGTMLEGIGHYGFHSDPDTRRILVVCSNPYPCEFDRGLVTTMATRFDRGARIFHDATQPCRANGADTCTYVIQSGSEG